MSAIFSRILNMSLTGSIVIAAVLLARFLLRRSPKKYAYALWAVVLFRLLCPVSISAPVSALEVAAPRVQQSGTTSVLSYLPQTAIADADFTPVYRESLEQTDPEPVGYKPTPAHIASIVWITGVCAMAGCSLLQYIRLRKRLAGAVGLGMPGRVYTSERIDTAFVLGFFRPEIYIPAHIPQQERTWILAHERCHIRRFDPLWKLLGFGALCLHWFNPLVWLAFFLACKDMEMSCDEAVIRAFGPDCRADYSAALLHCSVPHSAAIGMPLAFGEGNTKSRILNLSRWKKPKVWLSVLCAAVCTAVLVACALNPKQGAELPVVSGSAGIGFGDFYFTLPEGFTYRLEELAQKPHTMLFRGILSKDGSQVGTVMEYARPEVLDDDFQWQHDLDLPEWKDSTLGFFADATPDGTGGIGQSSLEFFSDVPTEQERTVKRLHTFFFYGESMYDLCLDEMLLDDQEVQEILSTASVGTAKKETPALPYQIADLPEGYSVLYDDSGILITDGTQIVGGIIGYSIPEGVCDTYDQWFEWLADVGIPDYEDSSLRLDSAMSDFRGGWHANFQSIAEVEGEPEVKRSHHFTVRGTTVYDVWLDEKVLDSDTRDAIYGAIHYIEPTVEHKTLTVNLYGEDITCDAELIVRPGYAIYLPSEGWPFGSQEIISGVPTDTLEYGEDENIRLSIATLAGKDLRQAQQWVMENWPEYQMIEDKQGGVGGADSQGNILMAQFHCAEGVTYAVIQQYPQLAAANGGMLLSPFTDTFTLTQDSAEPVMTQEELDFLKCLAVMGSASDGPCWIVSEQELDGVQTTLQLLGTEEATMVLVQSDQDGFRREAYMEFGDDYFCNSGHETEQGEIVWHPCEDSHDFAMPAMASCIWNKHFTRYMGSTEDETGECISYTMIGYDDDGKEIPIRNVNFYFDPDGNFIRSQWEILADFAESFTKATESFVSVDAEEITAEIEREYRRAIS